MTSPHSTQQHLLPLTSSVEDSRASLFPSPGSERARAMTVSSGLRCSKLSRLSGPLGYLERMCLASSRWASTVCFLTWKDSATPSGRLLFRLVRWTHRIDGTGFGLWPTAVAHDIHMRTTKHAQGGTPLTMAVQFWPTPNAGDHKAGMSNAAGRQQSSLPRTVGIVEGKCSGKRGGLNPVFVEWLMGFPDNWTELDASETP